MRIVIVGAGRVGARLANLLHEQHDVTVIDVDEHAFRRLTPTFRGLTIQGNGIDVDTLRAGGAEGADILLAMTNGDNRNLMAAQVAKAILDVETVIARVYDPVRAVTFSEMGLNTICPTMTGAKRLFEKITGGEVCTS